jgi:chaperonin GroES
VLLASDSGDKPNFGTVVAVGEGKKAEDGAQAKPNVAVGATVMYSKYSGTEYEVRQGRLGAEGKTVS